MKKVLIVDGYNVIRQTVPYSRLADSDLEAARTALVSDIAAYAHGEWDATVVFDGASNAHSDGSPHVVAGIGVVFSPYGQDADTVIEMMARAARDRADEVVVVTSDAQTQWAVMGGGVARMSSSGFSEELREGAVEWRDHAPAGSVSSRIEDRVDPEVRRALHRLVHGDKA